MTMLFTRMRARYLLVVVLLMALIAISTGPLGSSFASAQSSNQVVWNRYDVDFVINKDGTVHVTETQVVHFDGRFTKGFADIPVTGTDRLTNVEVSIANGADEDPQPADKVPSFRGDSNTYADSTSAGTMNLDYGFQPTSTANSTAENTRIIVIEYDLIGAIRVYDNLDPANQQFRWIAISSDVTSVAPIRDSTVTITLPEKVDPAQTVAKPDGSTTDGQTFTWTRSNLDQGDQFEVNLQFPPVTAATKPAWQDQSDKAREAQQQAEERSAVAGTLFLATGLFLLIGGPLLLIGLWYVRGRDPEIGLVADIIAQPPDDLRPGAAGTLIDEVTHSRDVIATVFDLARRGIIRMDEKQTEGFMGFGKQTRHTLTLLKHDEDLQDYEQVLLDAIFGPGAQPDVTVGMEQVQQSFAVREETIHKGFYGELVQHGYFNRSPEQTRQRAQFLRFVGPLLAAVIVILIIVFTKGNSGFIALPIIAAVILFIVGGKVASHMPRKTLKGAEAAAKWNAFKRYLEQIEQHENLEESKAIFYRYLPYATAFGLENSWIQKFSQTSAAMPEWFGGGPLVMGPGGMGRPRRGPGGVWIFPSGDGSRRNDRDDDYGGPGGGGGGGGMPDLQGMSDSAAGGLQGGSDGIFDMLGTAAEIFGGGGGTMGGGSFGGWKGGGGGFGGFSGGGGFGGGGGGGGRGFG